jgi:hypothetical protein
MPGVYSAGTWISLWAVRERNLARLLAPGVAISLWMLSIHLTALASGSFWIGLFGGTLWVVALPYALQRPEPPDVVDGPELGKGVWIAAGLAVLAMLGTELRLMAHDEYLITGHLSIPEEMLNGFYPPRHLAFPQFELRYHYGFDVLSAAVAALFAQPSMRVVVHAITLLLWGYTACLAWCLGRRWTGVAAGGPIAAAVILFAGGFPYLCRAPLPIAEYLEGDCEGLDIHLTPPVPSIFLQHPWSLGIPLMLCLLLLFAEVRGSSRMWWACSSLLMLALSLSQLVLYGGLLVAAGLQLTVYGTGRLVMRAFRATMWASTLTVLAGLMHGFFAKPLEPQSLSLELRPFWSFPPAELALWLLQSFGLVLLLGPVGIAFLRKGRLLVGTVTALSLGAFLMFNYPNSWDIIKFSMAAMVGLAIGTAGLLARGWSRPPLWRAPALAAVLLVPALGVSWLAGTAMFHRVGRIAMTSPDEDTIIAFLRSHLVPGESVLRLKEPIRYAIYGGLPIMAKDVNAKSLGFSEGLVDDREDLTQQPAQQDIEVYLKQAVRWVVVEQGEKEKDLAATVHTWQSQGLAELVLSAGSLDLFRIHGGRPIGFLGADGNDVR